MSHQSKDSVVDEQMVGRVRNGIVDGRGNPRCAIGEKVGYRPIPHFVGSQPSREFKSFPADEMMVDEHQDCSGGGPKPVAG